MQGIAWPMAPGEDRELLPVKPVLQDGLRGLLLSDRFDGTSAFGKKWKRAADSSAEVVEQGKKKNRAAKIW